MENKLEQLLNKLIEKGWKPRGKNYGVVDFLGTLVLVDLNDGRISSKNALNLRRLTSKESGLWQFCEENKMLIGFSPRTRTKNAHETYGSILGDIEYWGSDYEYRLIESALRDENKLEDFLLQNIIIKDE